MNKADLVDAVASATGVTKKDAGLMLEALMEAVMGALKKGSRVTLTGFGTFMVSQRKARTGRNPQSGEVIKIPARKVAKFKPGKMLRDMVK